MSEEQLKKDIKNNAIRNLYLFYGNEEYLKRNYAEYIEKKLLPESVRVLNSVVLEGRIAPAEIVDNCETLPVFSDRKVVIAKNTGIFKNKKKNEDSEKETKSDDILAGFLQNVPPHVCMIFIEDEIDKNAKYIELVKKYGLIVELNHRKPEEMADWIIKMFRTRGYETDKPTAAFLAEYCEPSMDEVLNEIEKLCAYAADSKRIGRADIEKVCTKSIKSRIFDLTDAIAARQCAKAFLILNDMVLLKEPMTKVMYMIAKQLRQLLQVRLLIDAGTGQNDIASRLKLKPFVLGKILRQARSFPKEKLEAALAVSLELDVAVKTGRLEDRAAVELFIASLSN